MREKKYRLMIATMWCLCSSLMCSQQPEDTYTRQASTPSVHANKFMVVTANPVATKLGYAVLEQGGNAIDAAVAIQLMLNLVEPQSSGIGGGGFLLYWDAKNHKLTSYDGRSTAPMAVSANYFLDENGKVKPFWQTVSGGGSVGVPGVLKLLEVAHKAHGSLPWAELFAPTIAQAEQGFVVSPRLADSIAAHADEIRALGRFQTTRDYFFTTEGKPRPAGSVLTNQAFADSLRAVASGGADVFYHGALAKQIVEAVQQPVHNKGLLTGEDLASYRALERPVVCVDYRGYQICGMGPSSSGGITVGQIMGMMNNFTIPAVINDTTAVHRYLEATKLAFADRNLYIADSDFQNVPTAGLLDPGYLRYRSSLIQDDESMQHAQPGIPPGVTHLGLAPHIGPERSGTTHFVIRDQEGNAVSMTSSIETGFGSRIMVGGFLLNNDLTDFSRQAREDDKPVANSIAGGKRPRSSMAPTMVMKDHQPYLLLGSPGGSRIIDYVSRALIAILDWGMEPQAALDLGHIISQGGTVELEEDTDAIAMERPLQKLGHHTDTANLNSGLGVILILPDQLIGGADPRREGLALGY